jgi:peptidoglycan/xylan/chitin deacetylase (PgdA/CDA1 family)
MKKTLKKLVARTGLRRQHVAAARMFAERHLLATTVRRPQRNAGRILAYHSLGQAEMGVNDVAPARFHRHIELALNAGFRFVPAGDIARTGGGKNDLAITFDDGFKSVLTEAVPILGEYAIPWSVFVVSEWSGERHSWAKEFVLPWRDLEKLLAHGAEIGSHSATHPDFGRIPVAQMVDELTRSRREIARELGVTPNSFAIPLGQSMNWPAAAAEAAREAGYDIIYAQAEDTRPSGTTPRTFVTRFDGDRVFKALLRGAFDRWEEWV